MYLVQSRFIVNFCSFTRLVIDTHVLLDNMPPLNYSWEMAKFLFIFRRHTGLPQTWFISEFIWNIYSSSKVFISRATEGFWLTNQIDSVLNYFPYEGFSPIGKSLWCETWILEEWDFLYSIGDQCSDKRSGYNTDCPISSMFCVTTPTDLRLTAHVSHCTIPGCIEAHENINTFHSATYTKLVCSQIV